MERNYVIPLRRAFQKVPTYRKAEKAVSATKKFLIKHMKVENVKLGRHLNMELWKNGPRNPPHKVEVNVELIKDKEDGDYEDYLVVKENYGSNLVNAVSIKVVYRVEGGDFSNENLNLEDVKVGDYGFSILYGIALVGLLGVGSFGYIRKKKFKKKGEL